MLRTPPSMRRFLLLGTALIIAIGLVLSALITYRAALHEFNELFDARLAQSAQITEPLLLHHLDELDATNPKQPLVIDQREHLAAEDKEHFQPELIFQLFDKDGLLLIRSENVLSAPFTRLHDGYYSQKIADAHWRSYVRYNTLSQTWLVIAERDDERIELAEQLIDALLKPQMVTLPLIFLLLWWVISRGMVPLTSLTRMVSMRHPNNLSPLHLERTSKELTLLTDELNRLMARLNLALDKERKFTDEAAHELRTPLTVLRIHCENAMAAKDEVSKRQALGKVLQALDRSDRLIKQLLTHARIENGTHCATPIDLRQQLRETIGSLAPLALHKNQQIGLEANEAIWVKGVSPLLDILFANVIDNAIRYTPQGGSITIRLTRSHAEAIIEVEDDGPGVPPELLPRLQERFFRVHQGHGDGVGLGMAIVSRIVEHHQGEIAINNHPPHGLNVTIRIPGTNKPLMTGKA